MKEANKQVIVTKTVITIDYLDDRSKSRSLWNCEIHFEAEQQKKKRREKRDGGWVGGGGVNSTFAQMSI